MSSLFSVRKQLAFYGAYHSHPVNVWIHMFGVPAIVWSTSVLCTLLPPPPFLPPLKYVINDYMTFETNFPSTLGTLYVIYYFMLDPIAASLYAPQMAFFLLTGTAHSRSPDGIRHAVVVQVISWIAQFIGHSVAEGRAPALLDNIVGALVLAPFFVHLEMLFKMGYRPELQKQLRSDIGMEIAKIRKEKAEKQRAKIKSS